MWGAREGTAEGEVSDERKSRRDLVWDAPLLPCSCCCCRFLQVEMESLVVVLLMRLLYLGLRCVFAGLE